MSCFFLEFIHVYKCFAHMNVCVPNVYKMPACRSQKKLLDALKLKLQTLVSHCVCVLEIKLESSAKPSSTLNL